MKFLRLKNGAQVCPRPSTRQLRQGYILLFSVSIIAGVSMVLLLLAPKAYDYVRANHEYVERYQMREYALSGIDFIRMQLEFKEFKAERDYFTIARLSNRWHKVDLGIDGLSLQVYVSCQDGKIPLNHLLELLIRKKTEPTFGSEKTKNALKEAESAFEKIADQAEKIAQEQDPHIGGFKKLEELLKQKGYPIVERAKSLGIGRPLDDPSDWFTFDGQALPLKFIADTPGSGSQSLFDLFAFRPSKETDRINLAYVSRTVAQILDLDVSGFERQSPETIANFTSDKKTLYTACGGLAAQLDQKKHAEGLFSVELKPESFMVLSYAQLAQKQVVLAGLLERNQGAQGLSFKVKRVYWLYVS